MGLIPAHAGKTETLLRFTSWLRAHPRSRGENTGSVSALIDWRGSSPLTRGKRGVLRAAAHPKGLIPAHAGKTIHSTNRADSCGAHPRSRGENRTGGAGVFAAAGSSPLTRGKRHRSPRTCGAHGLIPAHAGKTNSTLVVSCQHGAHPRSRGENYWPVLGRVEPAGSSPLTRGKRSGRS